MFSLARGAAFVALRLAALPGFLGILAPLLAGIAAGGLLSMASDAASVDMVRDADEHGRRVLRNLHRWRRYVSDSMSMIGQGVSSVLGGLLKSGREAWAGVFGQLVGMVSNYRSDFVR